MGSGPSVFLVIRHSMYRLNDVWCVDNESIDQVDCLSLHTDIAKSRV